MTDDRLAAGAAAYQRGEIAEALRIFDEAARVSTGAVRISAMINAASMADELGEHTRAVASYRQALADMPDDDVRMRTAALINLSQALQHLGDLDGAGAVLGHARGLLERNPGEERTLLACLLSTTAVAIHMQAWRSAEESARESLRVAMQYAPELAGHALLNLAAISFETGRHDAAFDFAGQARTAFVGNPAGTAEVQQNLGLMYLRSGRNVDAAPELLSSQAYFEHAGVWDRCAIGLKAQGFLAEAQGTVVDAHGTAASFYERSLALFDSVGAELEAADVRVRLATVRFAADPATAEALIATARAAYARQGLGVRCAQLDYWHAALLESDPRQVRRALAMAVPAAVAIDSIRYRFTDGYQRDRWHRVVAEPATSLAFRLAFAAGDALLISDLIETQCAGTSLALSDATAASAELPFVVPEPPRISDAADLLQLGLALADVAVGSGVPVDPPPTLVDPHGRVVLEVAVRNAAERYGLTVRSAQVIRA